MAKRQIRNRILQFYKKSPKIVIASLVVFVALIGAGSYGIYTTTSLNNTQTTSNKSTDDKSLKKPTSTIGSIASEAETKEDKTVDASKPTTITAYTPKCKGAGCPTANAGFSIITNKAITVTVGQSVGPFTASTSNGSSVNWSTPGGTSTYTPEPSGYTWGGFVGSTFQYYIRAESSVAPGTYTLTMSATQSSTQSLVRASMTVTVVAATPGQTYTPPPAPTSSAPSPGPYPTMSPSYTPTPTPTPTP